MIWVQIIVCLAVTVAIAISLSTSARGMKLSIRFPLCLIGAGLIIMVPGFIYHNIVSIKIGHTVENLGLFLFALARTFDVVKYQVENKLKNG